LRGHLLEEGARDMLSMLPDLIDVPALNGRHRGKSDDQAHGDDLAHAPCQENVEVAGVENVHEQTLAPTTDSSGG
jgi:hypothetical protein